MFIWFWGYFKELDKKIMNLVMFLYKSCILCINIVDMISKNIVEL